MTSDPSAPTEILTLGSLSQAPDLFNKNESMTSKFGVFAGAVDVVGSIEKLVSTAAASSLIIQSLSAIRPEATLIGKIVGRANDIIDTFPPVWYVNFPAQINDSQRESLRQHSQAMMDFKCWSSLKWWATVFKNMPSSNDTDSKMRQSGLFVQIASKDLMELPWFHTVIAPIEAGGSIKCQISDLHSNIMNLAIATFQNLDDISRRALEPVLQGVVASASDRTVEYRDQRMVFAEKHEYRSATNTIRLISFEIGESFYDVQGDKNSSSRWLECGVRFLQYDAEFDLDKWKSFSATLDPQQKKATEDFINRQTIDIDT